MELVHSSETPVNFYKNTWGHIPEHSTLHSYRCENPKPSICTSFCTSYYEGYNPLCLSIRSHYFAAYTSFVPGTTTQIVIFRFQTARFHLLYPLGVLENIDSEEYEGCDVSVAKPWVSPTRDLYFRYGVRLEYMITSPENLQMWKPRPIGHNAVVKRDVYRCRTWPCGITWINTEVYNYSS
jgi:hypothetical protein